MNIMNKACECWQQNYKEPSRLSKEDAALDNPRVGDYWNEMLCPIAVVVAVLGNSLRICKKTKDLAGGWTWDLSETCVMTKNEFKTWLCYDAIPAYWATVAPVIYPWVAEKYAELNTPKTKKWYRYYWKDANLQKMVYDFKPAHLRSGFFDEVEALTKEEARNMPWKRRVTKTVGARIAYSSGNCITFPDPKDLPKLKPGETFACAVHFDYEELL